MQKLLCEYVGSKVELYFEDGYFVVDKNDERISQVDCCMLFDLVVKSFPVDEPKELSCYVQRRRLQLDIASAIGSICAELVNRKQ